MSSLSFLENPKKTLDLFNSLRNIVNWTDTQSCNEKVFYGSELYKHLATSALSQSPVFYLNLLALRGAEIIDRML